MKDVHKSLQDVAIGWLYGVGCSIFAKEVPTENGIADALGVKTLHGKDDVYYIEAKASRSDLICKKQKAVYANATGTVEKKCYYHTMRLALTGELMNPEGANECGNCHDLKMGRGDTGVDFYYIIVAEGLTVESGLYPAFGVINHKGDIVRKAKRMIRNDKKGHDLIVAVAHVLVYKVFGKMYGG